MKVYRTEKWGIEITEFEAERETDKCYFIRGLLFNSDKATKVNKVAEFHEYHKSFNDAVDYLRQREIAKLEMYETEVKQCQGNIEILKTKKR